MRATRVLDEIPWIKKKKPNEIPRWRQTMWQPKSFTWYGKSAYKLYTYRHPDGCAPLSDITYIILWILHTLIYCVHCRCYALWLGKVSLGPTSDPQKYITALTWAGKKKKINTVGDQRRTYTFMRFVKYVIPTYRNVTESCGVRTIMPYGSRRTRFRTRLRISAVTMTNSLKSEI